MPKSNNKQTCVRTTKTLHWTPDNWNARSKAKERLVSILNARIQKKKLTSSSSIVFGNESAIFIKGKQISNPCNIDFKPLVLEP